MKFVTQTVPAGLLKCIVAALRSGEAAEVVLDFGPWPHRVGPARGRPCAGRRPAFPATAK